MATCTKRKVVYNACYGGFSLSEAGMRRYAELKGLTLFIEQDPEFPSIQTYWLVPPEERTREGYDESTLSDRDFIRHDPLLVQVVEELGDAASGGFAELKIAIVNGKYRIDEYDGLESVMTPDDYEWVE